MVCRIACKIVVQSPFDIGDPSQLLPPNLPQIQDDGCCLQRHLARYSVQQPPPLGVMVPALQFIPDVQICCSDFGFGCSRRVNAMPKRLRTRSPDKKGPAHRPIEKSLQTVTTGLGCHQRRWSKCARILAIGSRSLCGGRWAFHQEQYSTVPSRSNSIRSCAAMHPGVSKPE